MPDYGRIDEMVEPELEPEPEVLEEGDLHMMDACEPVAATAIGSEGEESAEEEEDVEKELDAEQ